jgi:dihydroxy-acid dehydratase
VKDGDTIKIDVRKKSIELLVNKAELARREKALKAFTPKVKHGWLARYALHVTSADRGGVFDI